MLIADTTSIMPPAKVQNFANGIYFGTKALSEVVLVRCPIPNNSNINAKKHLPTIKTALKKDLIFSPAVSFILTEAKIKKPPDNASVLFKFTQYFNLSARVVADKNEGK